MNGQGERQGAAPSFAELFAPKRVTVLREGCGSGHLRADVVAGLTVAIAALPLAIAMLPRSGWGGATLLGATFIFRALTEANVAGFALGSVLNRLRDGHKALIVDFSGVPFREPTGADMIEGLARKARAGSPCG